MHGPINIRFFAASSSASSFFKSQTPLDIRPHAVIAWTVNWFAPVVLTIWDRIFASICVQDDVFPRKNHCNVRVDWVRIGSENCTGRAWSKLDETSDILNRIFEVHGHLKSQKEMDVFFCASLSGLSLRWSSLPVRNFWYRETPSCNQSLFPQECLISYFSLSLSLSHNTICVIYCNWQSNLFRT